MLALCEIGFSVDHSTGVFEKLAKVAFKRRKVSKIPLVPRLVEYLISYFADGLYPPENIEAALKHVFGTEKGILDYSHATSTGTRVGLPVATVDDQPSSRIFTNYNGVGEGGGDRHQVIKPKDGSGNVPLWEMQGFISISGFAGESH